MQAVHRELKVLVCAPSNIAVDTVLARLATCRHSSSGDSRRKKGKDHKASGGGGDGGGGGGGQLNLQMVRLGHPARISSDILKYSLDALIAADEVRR